jgi:hypothetical protein
MPDIGLSLISGGSTVHQKAKNVNMAVTSAEWDHHMKVTCAFGQLEQQVWITPLSCCISRKSAKDLPWDRKVIPLIH